MNKETLTIGKEKPRDIILDEISITDELPGLKQNPYYLTGPFELAKIGARYFFRSKKTGVMIEEKFYYMKDEARDFLESANEIMTKIGALRTTYQKLNFAFNFVKAEDERKKFEEKLSEVEKEIHKLFITLLA